MPVATEPAGQGRRPTPPGHLGLRWSTEDSCAPTPLGVAPANHVTPAATVLDNRYQPRPHQICTTHQRPPATDPVGCGLHPEWCIRAARYRGPIVAGSLIAGLVTATGLVAAPFVGTRENTVTGAVLLGFALGWALLAALSTWRSDQPQRWAFVPAVFMTVAGGVLIVGSETLVHGVLDWV